MNEIEDQIKWDAYLIPGTEVLNNKLGITDLEKLKEEEKIIVRKKLAYLYLKPIQGDFDLEHLKDMHKFILLLENLELVRCRKLQCFVNRKK